MSTRIWSTAATVFLFSSLVACGSMGGHPSPVTTQAVTVEGEGSVLLTRDPYSDTDRLEHSVEEVWQALDAVYAALEIPVDYRVSDDFILGNRNYNARQLGGERMSRWLDCGRNVTTGRANADTYDVWIEVLTGLTAPEGEEIGTGVTTWVRGRARSRGASGDPIACTTRNELEPRILELLELELARRAVARG
jgi:hypothetical protein